MFLLCIETEILKFKMSKKVNNIEIYLKNDIFTGKRRGK